MKRLQNRIAESRMVLPVMIAYGIGVWLLAGLTVEGWWIQFACFAVSTYLMVELNNKHALIRIFSRMVSCTFIALSCAACFLFPSLSESVVMLCFIGILMLLFMTYQDKQTSGYTYYAYLLLGTASLACVHVLCLLPVLWLLSVTQLQSLSWRTWGASLIGVLTPYWIWGCWVVYQGDAAPMTGHILQLAVVEKPLSYMTLGMSRLALLALIVVLYLACSVRYLWQQHNDRIRIRQLYGFMIWADLYVLLFIILQPQHMDRLLGIAIALTSPIVAHATALTVSKVANILFFVVTGIVIALTVFNLWTISSLY